MPPYEGTGVGRGAAVVPPWWSGNPPSARAMAVENRKKPTSGESFSPFRGSVCGSKQKGGALSGGAPPSLSQPKEMGVVSKLKKFARSKLCGSKEGRPLL